MIGLIESDKFENRFNKTFNRGTDRSGWFTVYAEHMWAYCPLKFKAHGPWTVGLGQLDQNRVDSIFLNVANA